MSAGKKSLRNPNLRATGSYATVRHMKLRWGVCLLSVACAYGQVEQKPQMAEEVFKNIQVLKGISVNELMETMGFFAASLGLNCTDCHVSESSGNWARYADDTGSSGPRA